MIEKVRSENLSTFLNRIVESGEVDELVTSSCPRQFPRYLS